MDSNHWPLRYCCSALPTELSSQLRAVHIVSSFIIHPSNMTWCLLMKSELSSFLLNHCIFIYGFWFWLYAGWQISTEWHRGRRKLWPRGTIWKSRTGTLVMSSQICNICTGHADMLCWRKFPITLPVELFQVDPPSLWQCQFTFSNFLIKPFLFGNQFGIPCCLGFLLSLFLYTTCGTSKYCCSNLI